MKEKRIKLTSDIEDSMLTRWRSVEFSSYRRAKHAKRKYRKRMRAITRKEASKTNTEES